MAPEPLGTLLRRLRTGADLTLEQLAERSGVSDRALGDIERGAALGPHHRTMLAIAGGLRLPEPERSALVAAARAGRRRAGPRGAPPVPPDSLPDGGTHLPLPRAVADFAGRARELAALTAALRDLERDGDGTGPTLVPAPVVVVTGPPGYGKTSLAVQAAALLRETFPEQVFLDLGAMSPVTLAPGEVIAELMGALGSQRVEGRSDPARLRDLLKERRVLLILDDAGSEAQVRAVLPGSGPAAVLVTSRRALTGLDGVHRIHLDRLADADAQAMLATILPRWQASAPELARLAQFCDGVPLALRIAGNRLASRRGWTVAKLTERLAVPDRRLDALTAGDLTIRTAVGLSYRQLGAAAQRLFRRLALADGRTFGPGVAAAVSGLEVWHAEDLLDELVELGLVQPAVGDRYLLHDLLRLYAHAEFGAQEAPASREQARAVADTWLLDTVVRAGRWFEPEILGAGSADLDDPVPLRCADDARAWLTAEADNWFPALQRAARADAHERVIEVAESLHWFSDLWPTWGRWHTLFGASAEAAQSLGDEGLRATHLGYLAWAQRRCRGDHAAAMAAAGAGLEAARRSGDPVLTAWAQYYVAWTAREDDPVLSLSGAAAAAGLFRQVGDREGLPQAIMCRAIALARLGRATEAVGTLREVVDLVTDPATRPRGQVAEFTAAQALAAIARVWSEHADWRAAVGSAGPAIHALERVGDRNGIARMHLLRARGHQALGERGAALAAAESASRGFGDSGNQVDRLEVRDLLVELARP
ncbi:XRE family transcriptional regulator [Occultella glacieicola]|uniref:XRE family transcriptional regulator n=1 Tax=Occultella glacieicola TaxID=2518684 RepID=A0ABY2E3J1_9MICO|nr:helix-turn-helix domain-containing protein [Occultella glacieicola]TDE92686.1 XRE family transcriptional regulator [Occultella glacieicola]